MRGPTKTKLRLKLEALQINESISFNDNEETKLAQFISWELRKKFGRKFSRRGLTITRLEDDFVKNNSIFLVVLYGIAKTELEGPFDTKRDATEWLKDYVPFEPGRNMEPEFGQVIGPIGKGLFREF